MCVNAARTASWGAICHKSARSYVSQLVRRRRRTDPSRAELMLNRVPVGPRHLYGTSQTVATTRPVHSLHAYFIRPGSSNEPIGIELERLRGGRSFSTCRVVARQSGGLSSTCRSVSSIPRRKPSRSSYTYYLPTCRGWPTRSRGHRIGPDARALHRANHAGALTAMSAGLHNVGFNGDDLNGGRCDDRAGGSCMRQRRCMYLEQLPFLIRNISSKRRGVCDCCFFGWPAGICRCLFFPVLLRSPLGKSFRVLGRFLVDVRTYVWLLWVGGYGFTYERC